MILASSYLSEIQITAKSYCPMTGNNKETFPLHAVNITLETQGQMSGFSIPDSIIYILFFPPFPTHLTSVTGNSS